MYAGLTTADKGALLDAKAVGFKVFCETSNGGRVFYSKYPSVSEANSRIISIDLALAQIEEMETALTQTALLPNEKCPICEYAISGCQCLYSGSAHPDRHDKKRVVIDHLYLLSPTQVQHVISLEKHWQISYADEILNAILKKLIANSPYTEGEKA